MKKVALYACIQTMQSLLLCFTLCLSSYTAKATNIDSLRSILLTSKNLNEKIVASGRIVGAFESNYDSALYYGNQYLDLWKNQKNKFGEAYIYHHLGSVALENSKYDKAKEFLNTAITLCDEIGNDSLKAKTLMRLGFIYYTEADYETAIKTYHSALKIADKIGNQNITSWAYNLLGLAFRSKPIPDHNKALEYYFKALEIDTKNKSSRGMGMLCLRIGSVYTSTGSYDKAEHYLTQALRIADSLNIAIVKKWTLEAMAGLYKKKKDYMLAIAINKKSLQMSKETNESPGIIISYTSLADIHKLLKDYKTADKYIDSAIKVSLDKKIQQTLSSVYSIKSAICEGKGDLSAALYFNKRSVAIKDSLFSLQNSNNINDLETKYQTQKKEQSIQLLNKQKESDERVKMIFIIALSISALLICIIVYFLFNLIRSRKIIAAQKLETEKQKDIVVEKQKEIIESISYAKRLQDAILPSKEFINSHLVHNFILYRPKDLVAGDFYWAECIGDHFFIAAADSTGHGVPGALVSVVCSNALNRTVKEFQLTDPGDILNKTRELVIETFEKSSNEVKDGMDISLLSIKLPNAISNDLEIKWSGANNPLWYIQDGSLKEIKGNKQPIGKIDQAKPFTTHRIDHKTGTSFYLFTDGIADQFGGEKGKKFKYKQLNTLLLKSDTLPAEEQSQLIAKTFDSWKGDLEQVDDVCIIGIRL